MTETLSLPDLCLLLVFCQLNLFHVTIVVSYHAFHRATLLEQEGNLVVLVMSSEDIVIVMEGRSLLLLCVSVVMFMNWCIM